MDVKEIIASGMIEEYCLGLQTEKESAAIEHYAVQYPVIKQEIEAFMLALEQYAMDNAVSPGHPIKNRLLDIIHNFELERSDEADQLPLLNKYTDYRNWLKIAEPFLPGKMDGMFIHELRNDNGVAQLLICTTVDYPDEVHEDEQECFIILRGRCRCLIEDKVVEMGPGDFIEIPMYKHHDVRILEPVIAVVQRIKVA